MSATTPFVGAGPQRQKGVVDQHGFFRAADGLDDLAEDSEVFVPVRAGKPKDRDVGLRRPDLVQRPADQAIEQTAGGLATDPLVVSPAFAGLRQQPTGLVHHSGLGLGVAAVHSQDDRHDYFFNSPTFS